MEFGVTGSDCGDRLTCSRAVNAAPWRDAASCSCISGTKNDARLCAGALGLKAACLSTFSGEARRPF